MDDQNLRAGTTLRHLREKRQITLRQAARLLHTSAPVLSRKERGQIAVARVDIRLAVAGYQLDAWEAHQLWMTAGFVAESELFQAHQQNLHQLAELLLPRLIFPAFIMDNLAYLHAWNEGIELIWGPSTSGDVRINIIDDLFSQRVRIQMGLRWDTYIVRALRIFRQKTADLRNDPAFRRLVADLANRHGEVFVRKWNEAEQGVGDFAADLDLGAVTVTHDSPEGYIDYVVTRTTWQVPLTCELTIYVPFGPENIDRYARLGALTDLSRLYFSRA